MENVTDRSVMISFDSYRLASDTCVCVVFL